MDEDPAPNEDDTNGAAEEETAGTVTTAAGAVHRSASDPSLSFAQQHAHSLAPSDARDAVDRPPPAPAVARYMASASVRLGLAAEAAATAVVVASVSSSSTATAATATANRQSLLRQQAHSAVPSYQQRASSPVVAAHRAINIRPFNVDGSGVGRSAVSLLNDINATAPEREMGDDPNIPTTGSGWSHVEPGVASVPPSARSLHAAALLNGSLYIFGGYSGAERVNTFHAYSFAEKRWSPVLPSAHSTHPPSPRDRHVSLAFGNSVYVHGGFDGTSRISDFWAFDFSTMTWREVVALQGRAPSPRHSHAAVVHGHSAYFYGGYDGSYKSDLHEFDIALSRWSAVPAAGRRPRARYRATAVVHKNQMILYGGHDGTRHLSDTHVFDFDTSTWSSLVTEGTPPIPRDSHVSVIHSNSMYVFGGSSGSAMNDLHELQLPDNSTSPARWRPVNTTRREQPQHRFCHVAVVYNDSLWVFGGYNGSDRLNDFIRFDFAVYDLSFEVPPSTIISDFQAMINDSTFSDVTFIVEDQPVYAHKLMLMRCSYFQALFLGDMRESRLSTIRIEQVSHSIFLAILEYLYTDQLRIPFHHSMEVFEAADLFMIPRLKTMCEKRMLQSITVENAANIFHASDMHSATALRQKAKKYILSHFEEVSKSYSFEEMGRSNIELVFELLQSR
jgi:N-acetylneuraminic acid mutarotase